MKQDIKKYLKDLKIIYYYLRKFYYNSSSEWLKKDILKCLNALSIEIMGYQELITKNNKERKVQPCTIYDFLWMI